MASILKVDEMQGVTSAGDITITSEGGAATQSLQQGLCKTWCNLNFTSTTPRDDINIASITDNGTADMTLTYTNAMSNNNYATSGMSGEVSGSGNPDGIIMCARAGGYDNAFGTSFVRVRCVNVSGTAIERAFGAVSIHGDLA